MQSEIIRVLEDYVATVRQNLEMHNINASHRTERSLRIVQRNGHVQVVIGGQDKTAPAHTLQVGRGPGPVPYNLQDILFQWLKDKGLKASMDIANAIKWKIHYHGTNRHHHPVDVYTEEGKEVKKKLQSALGAYFAKRLIETK